MRTVTDATVTTDARLASGTFGAASRVSSVVSRWIVTVVPHQAALSIET